MGLGTASTLGTRSDRAYPRLPGFPAYRAAAGAYRTSVSDAGARARINRICRFVPEARTLRVQVLAEFRSVIGFDSYAWLLTDPATAVGASPVADVPWLAELPAQIRLKYLTPVNRWTALGGRSVALLHETTADDPAQSLVWRDLLIRYGVGDVASAVFEDRFGCWGFLELWRSSRAGPFRRNEAAFLADLAEPLTAALRRCQGNSFAIRPIRTLPRVGPAVLLLSPELQVLGQTPETMEYLRVLVPPDADRQPIPAAAYNVAAQLLALEAGVDGNPPTARVSVSDGLWMTVRAARIEGPEPPLERNIAVTIEESSAAERVDLFARAFGLTARERELLDHLVSGKDTREVARRMFLSQNTVQDHLKSIFAKTGAHSRRLLLSRALGS